MHTGMLWFDNSAITLSAKIEKAVKYYKEKYQKTPDLILVHPSMLEGEETERKLEEMKIKLRPYRPVLPGHIWIGIEDKA